MSEMTAEQRAKGMVGCFFMPLSSSDVAVLARAINAAEQRGKLEAYEKARELVGFSANASHVIEAQMQQEFPDRAFVPSTQQRAGSRMDGSNMRMPKAPEQFREEGRVEMREKCRETASGLRKVASGKETNYGKGMAQAALLIEDAISRIATSSEEPAPSQPVCQQEAG